MGAALFFVIAVALLVSLGVSVPLLIFKIFFFGLAGLLALIGLFFWWVAQTYGKRPR